MSYVEHVTELIDEAIDTHETTNLQLEVEKMRDALQSRLSSGNVSSDELGKVVMTAADALIECGSGKTPVEGAMACWTVFMLELAQLLQLD